MHFRSLRGLSALLILGIAGVSIGQVRIGGARLTGLAGAGLALPYDAGQVVVNPGLYARRRKAAKLHGPLIDYYTRGMSFGDFQDLYGDIQGGGVDVDNLGDFAREFGRKRREIGGLGSIGATLGGVYVGYKAEVSAAGVPNQTLRQWARESGDPITLATTYSGAQLDGFGYAYESVDFAYGVPLQKKDTGTVNVGARLRNIKAYYSHHVVGSSTIASGGSGSPGPEMHGDDVLTRSGVGMDLGFMYTPQEKKSVHFGAVVENLVRPSIGFKRAEPETDDLKSFNPFDTALSIGAAYVPDKKFMAAADYIDVFDNANRAALRLGGEYRFNKRFAFSAGYNSRDTWSVGVVVYGVYIRFKGDNKLWLGQGLRF